MEGIQVLDIKQPTEAEKITAKFRHAYESGLVVDCVSSGSDMEESDAEHDDEGANLKGPLIQGFNFGKVQRQQTEEPAPQ